MLGSPSWLHLVQVGCNADPRSGLCYVSATEKGKLGDLFPSSRLLSHNPLHRAVVGLRAEHAFALHHDSDHDTYS